MGDDDGEGFEGKGFDDMGEGEDEGDAGDFGVGCFICDWEGTGNEAADAGDGVELRCPECGAYLDGDD